MSGIVSGTSQVFCHTIDIDYVVENGDKTFKEINLSVYLMLNELPREIIIMNYSSQWNF